MHPVLQPNPTSARQGLTPAQMYERVLASDAACNGQFFFGVLSTGVFCLPSCHARKPRPENVEFVRTAEAARAAGLRPCLKCHPEDFARGADPVLETIEAVVAEVRADPAAFSDVRAVVRRTGFGATRVFELFRQHYHTTPADLLLRARMDVVRRRLANSEDALAAIAYDAGFRALSAFHENFRRMHGLPPAAWRELRAARTFDVEVPAGYPLGYLRRALSRDPHSVSERWVGEIHASAIRLEGKPAILELQLSPKKVRATISHGSGPAAHRLVIGLLGLDQEAAAFSRLAERLGYARLVQGREQLRISQIPSVFDGLLWAIIGQQINFPFACLLRKRLVELAGTPVGAGLFAPPTPEAVAQLDVKDLLPLQFSRQKAGYVIGASRLVASGQLDLEALRTMSATRAERTLLSVRGLGPWSVNYLMMRSLGFADCLPLGDTGVTSGLRALFDLTERPDSDATRRLMAMFAPFRSLATAHLWQLNQPMPT
jgi:AraC family transcriptional regulator of adaptative response / DNA-3-methyladenine glycosylase II